MLLQIYIDLFSYFNLLSNYYGYYCIDTYVIPNGNTPDYIDGNINYEFGLNKGDFEKIGTNKDYFKYREYKDRFGFGHNETLVLLSGSSKNEHESRGLWQNFRDGNFKILDYSESIENAEKIAVHHAWFVRSFENDYNPTHIHTNGSSSCVLYLKIPPGISDKNSKNTHEKYATEGYIDFVYGSSSTVNPGNMCIQPKVGDLYIFPASLFHTVYPFYGEGERRSFSANISLQKGD